MTEEKNLTKIKKKKKQIKKSLPKNVFEIVGDAGELVERVEPKETGKVEKKRKEKADGDEKVQLSERTRKRKRREWDSMNYEKFDLTRAREHEKNLQRVATRGIVQLFNTVRKNQQNISSRPRKEKKRTPLNKGEFLDMLKNIDGDETSYKVLNKTSSTKTENDSKKPVRWSALQDDLMASVKDEDDD